MNLEEVAAHIEIRQVLYRYCRGVDRGDKALIAGVYHAGAEDRHGNWRGPGREFADFLVPLMDKIPLIGQHHITNVLVELRGEEADVESYFIAMQPETRADGPALAFVSGRYLDTFARRDGVWLIADREVVLDVASEMWSAAPWPGLSRFPLGKRREADPSSRQFGPAPA
jgi:hypothetical protein